jgi:hypothetical protein
MNKVKITREQIVGALRAHGLPITDEQYFSLPIHIPLYGELGEEPATAGECCERCVVHVDETFRSYNAGCYYPECSCHRSQAEKAQVHNYGRGDAVPFNEAFHLPKELPVPEPISWNALPDADWKVMIERKYNELIAYLRHKEQ